MQKIDALKDYEMFWALSYNRNQLSQNLRFGIIQSVVFLVAPFSIDFL